MPVKVISRTTTDALNSGSTSSLIGNVMDWKETVIRVEAYVGMHTQDNYTVEVNTDFTLKLYGANWADLGFEIGDSLTGVFNSTDATNIASAATSTSLGKTVLDIQGDIMTLDSTVNGFVNVQSFMPGQDAVRVYNYMYLNSDKTFTGIEFSFNEMLNSDINAPTLNSIIDATETMFQLSTLDVTNTSYVDMIAVNPKSGNSIESVQIKGVSKVGAVSTFDIKVVHNICGLYDQVSDIQTPTAPEWFTANECPTDTYKAKFYKTFGDNTVTVESSLDATIVKKLGNVGWFNENKNGGNSNYSITSVAFEDSIANTITGIQTEGTTQITIEIEDANSNFDAGTSLFNFGVAFVPLGRQDFQNNTVNNLGNLLANTMGVNQSYLHTASPVVSTIDGFENEFGARLDVTSYHFTVDSPNSAIITIIVEPYQFSDFLNTLTIDDRQMCFWVSCGTVATIGATDRVNVMYPCLALDAVEVLEPYDIDDVELFPYDLDFYNGDAPYIDTFANDPVVTEDDYHVNFRFKTNDNEVINSVTFGIDICDSSDNRLYVADSFTENLNGQPIDNNGTQQIAVTSARQFKYLSDFKDNIISLQRDSANDSGIERSYNFTVPFRMRYEWWKQNNALPTNFFVNTRPLNNLNFEWFRKQIGGAKLRHFIELTVTDDDGETTSYRNTYDIDIINYENDAGKSNSDLQVFPDDTFTTDSQIGTKTNQYLGELYGIIDGQDNFIQGTYTDLTSDISDYKYCEITIEVEDGAGWLSMWKIRSDQTPEANNPLQPLDGETALKVIATADTIITQCKVDPTLLQGLNYKITAEWISYRLSGEEQPIYSVRYLVWAKLLKLATPDPTEERTFGTCGYKIPVLASTTSTDLYKNDILGLLHKRSDSNFNIELYLIESDGTEHALNDNTYGTYFPFGSFNYEPNVVAYQVAWRMVLDELGEGCYSFKRVNTEFGTETTFYSCCYELKEFSVENAENTVRIETVQNGLIEELDINYKGLNWGSHLRFHGSFGYQEPNYDQDIIIDTNNNQQINRQDFTSEFILKSKLLPHKCVTKQIWGYYLRCTQTFISDYNSDNHSYDYISTPVLLVNPDTPKYIQRNRNAVISIRFKEKVLSHRLTTADGERPESYLAPDYVYTNQCPSPEIMTVDFEADKTTADADEDIDFTDLTDKSPTNWSWDFGDGTSSLIQNPTKSYSSPGTYDITLIAAKVGLGNIVTKVGYITVNYYQSLCSYYFNTDRNLTLTDGAKNILGGSDPNFNIRIILKRNSIGTAQAIVSNRNSVDNTRSILARFETDNKIKLWFSYDGINEYSVKTTNAFTSTTVWYDINITRDSSISNSILKSIVIVNGVAETMTLESGTIANAVDVSSNPLLVGKQSPVAASSFLDAYVNQFSILDIVPTEAQALAAYNSGSPIISSEYYDGANVQSEYLFDNDTWDTDHYNVIDDGLLGADGETEDMDAIDKDCNENPYT